MCDYLGSKLAGWPGTNKQLSPYNKPETSDPLGLVSQAESANPALLRTKLSPLRYMFLITELSLQLLSFYVF